MDGATEWVGRSRELATFAVAAESLRHGRGSIVWIEGEPGIGKSALIIRALAAESDPQWDIGWGTADPLSERMPLRVMQDCLGARPGSDDPRRARAAGALRDGRRGLLAEGDTPTAGIEELLTLADKLCADAPMVMVIDDLQWADDASLVLFHQLAVSVGQMPLLLIAICRPAPGRAEVRELRAAVERRGAAVVTLGPLPDSDVSALMTTMLGAPPGDALRRLADQAGGNPRYLRELVGAREQETKAGQLPGSLVAVLEDRLTAVSEQTGQMLRTAALLGGPFAVTDLGVLLGRPASALAAGVREAVAAGILMDSGPDLAFRHPLIRQALYESIPEALRTALHLEGAQELAARGADVLTVAQQLSMAERPGGDWTRAWLVEAAPALITRAPRLAASLLRREVDEVLGPGETRAGLLASLAQALLAAGSHAEAANRASQVLTETTDPARLAGTYSVLARAQVYGGQNDEAITTLRRALARTDLPRAWHALMMGLLAMVNRAANGDLDAVEALARESLSVAEEVGDAFAMAHGLADLWMVHSIRRDHAAALDCADRALRVLGDDPGYADLRSFAFDSRVVALQNLDRWPEAEATLRQAGQAIQASQASQVGQAARRDRNPDRGTWTVAALYRFWMGQWDDALAELDQGSVSCEGWPALLGHGVTALIAGRRDQRATAREHLRQGLALPQRGLPDWETRDFLLAAHALALEQGGDARQALRILAGIIPRRECEMTLVHLWLPDLVRLALAAGDDQQARVAARACAAEAAAETQPARAATASLRCQGLLRSDPGLLRDAVAHARDAGPAVELPAALEDLAAVLAERGEGEEARTALNEAVGLYEGFGARWDIQRADGRVRPYGIRRGARNPRGPRPDSGWEALTPTEIKIATLIGAGQSTSDIAGGMFLSRRTVQKHVSNILAKLGAHSRVEIVREVLRQGNTG